MAIGLAVMCEQFGVIGLDLMAISFRVTLLPLVVFVAQKYFIQGVTMTGLAG
ncbi:MAG: hypothetical protein R2867_38855 [Caldilineaceae bacterium]